MSKTFQLIIGVLCTSIHLTAQDTDPAAHHSELDSVTVTANKVAQKPPATGKIITVISTETIRQNAGRTLAQLLNDQAGITVNGALNNPGTRPVVYMRGGTDGRALILLDGMPLYDPSMVANDVDLNLFSLASIDRIEICRGAQSTMYGSDAIAGVINIITHTDKAEKPVHLRVGGTAGSYGLYKGNLDVSGRNKKLTYSARYAGMRSRGFSSALDSTGSNGFDNDGHSSSVISGNIKYAFSPRWSVRLFIQRSFNNTDIDDAAFTDEKDYTAENRSTLTGTSLTHTGRAFTFVFNYRYAQSKRIYVNDSGYISSVKYSSLDYDSRSHFADAYTKIIISKGLTLVGGADYRRGSMNSNYYSLGAFGAFSNVFGDTAHDQGSVYSSLLWKASEKIHIEGGARWNIHSAYGSNTTYTFNSSVNISRFTRLIAGIASAFKSPTLYQLYSQYGEAELQPEKSITFEAGVEYRNPKLFNRLVMFNRTIKDGIDFDYVGYKYFNSNEQTVYGIEYEGAYSPTSRMNVSLNYTYLQAKETSQSRMTFKDTLYHYLLRRPAHTVNVLASYSFDRGFTIRAGAKHVSSRRDIGGYQQPDVVLNAYTLLNLSVEYRLKSFLSLYADAQNITNKRFVEISGYRSLPFYFTTGFNYSL